MKLGTDRGWVELKATLIALVLASSASLIPTCVIGQAAPERHVWQDKRSFEPMSHTAQIITGSITLSGNQHFATPGTKMAITFGDGKSVTLNSVSAAWRRWDDNGKVTAEIFQFDRDPGKLEHDNTLCGKNHARFIVFFEDVLLNQLPFLGVAVFESQYVPWDINSPGLCGTFTFYSTEQ